MFEGSDEYYIQLIAIIFHFHKCGSLKRYNDIYAKLFYNIKILISFVLRNTLI